MFGWELQEGQIITVCEEQIPEFYKFCPPGTADQPTLFIGDEVQLVLNARDWAKQSRELLNFLTLSRHEHTDCIFISQSMYNIDKQIVRLVQYVYRFRDMRKYKILGLGIAWPLKQYVASQYDYDGKTLLDNKVRFINPDIFKLYESYNHQRKFPRLERKVIGSGKINKSGIS